MLLLDLGDTLRAGGCRVEVDPGAASRGQGQLAGVKAIICHHTGSVSANTWKVVRDGREGLRGLLSQLVLERDGLWRVLGSGQAWHAGSGGPLLGIPLNSANAWTIGIEAVSAGTAKGDWTAAQLAEYPRGVAALCRRYGLTEQRVIFHKTWAPTRKIDLAGWPGDLPAFRASVARHLATPPQEDPLMALSDAEQRELLDTTRKLAGWLSMPSFTPPGGDPSKPWSVTPGAAILNTYVGMFYGGSSTGNKSLFQTAAATGGPVDTAAIVAGVVDAITRQGLAKPVADELARRLAS